MAILGRIEIDGLQIITVDSDPISGLDLPIGTIAILNDGASGKLFTKIGSLTTDWTQAITATSGALSHTSLTNIGTNTHAQIDTHVASTSNPHSTTKSQIGLSNVDNTSDVNKPVSTAQASADSAVQAFSIQRANHTGSQTASTISDFSSAADARIALQKAAANGLATLDASVLLPASQHGSYSNGTNHAAATTSVNGFMSSVDKTKLDASGILTSSAPSNVTKSTAVVGASSETARADHKHDVSTAAAISISTSTTNTEGSSTNIARADHTHAVTITNSRVASLTLITTTSTTDVVMTGQSLTPAAGTYFAMARSLISATSNNRTITLSLYSDGSQVANTSTFTFIRTGSGILGGTSDVGNLFTEAFVTVNGSQAIDMRWNTTGGTAQAANYSLVLIKVA